MANNLVSTIADAITRQEGFFEGSASYKNNNPGNIMDLAYYKNTGQFKLATYSSLEEGRKALENLVQRYIDAGHTLNSFFARYAPSGHGSNQPNVYAANVASWTGLPRDQPLKNLDAAQLAHSSPSNVTMQIPETTSGSGEEGISILPVAVLMGVAALGIWWFLD